MLFKCKWGFTSETFHQIQIHMIKRIKRNVSESQIIQDYICQFPYAVIPIVSENDPIRFITTIVYPTPDSPLDKNVVAYASCNESKLNECKHLVQITNCTHFHANDEESLHTPYNFYDPRNLLGDFSDVNPDELQQWDPIYNPKSPH